MARVLWVIGAVVLVGLRGGLSCSDFLLNATAGEGCLSGRTFDFEIDVNHEIGYMPEGSTLTLLPVCQGVGPATMTTKHAFAFLASDRAVFKNISDELGVRDNDVTQVVSDGLNDKGLGMAMQWDYDVPGYPNATSAQCGSTSAVTALDLGAFILASFSTVEEVKQALNPTIFSVVNFQFSPKTQSALIATGLLGAYGYAFVHLIIHDAQHNSLVIEFKGDHHVLAENPTGVLANEPQLPGQLNNLASYKEQMYNVPQININGYVVFSPPGTLKPIHYNYSDSTFYTPPGDFSSQSRFVRLAMLNEVVGLRTWPAGSTYSPTTLGPSKALWVAAENILNTVVLPPSIDDGGGAGTTNFDFTQVAILRDHVNMLYYFKSATSPQWQAVNLKSLYLKWASLKNTVRGSLFGIVPTGINSRDDWFQDVSLNVL